MTPQIERLDLQVSMKLKFVMVLAAVTVFFLPLALFGFWMTRKYPRVLDREGVTLRNGERYEWKDLTELRHDSRFLPGPLQPMTLFFGKKAVVVAPVNLADSEQVAPFLSRVLGRSVQAMAAA